MSTQAQIQDAVSLLDLFDSCHVESLGRHAMINRVRDQWRMFDVIEDIGRDRTRELIEFYFSWRHSDSSLKTFFNKYDELNLAYKNYMADVERRARLRKQTREMVENAQR